MSPPCGSVSSELSLCGSPTGPASLRCQQNEAGALFKAHTAASASPAPASPEPRTRLTATAVFRTHSCSAASACVWSASGSRRFDPFASCGRSCRDGARSSGRGATRPYPQPFAAPWRLPPAHASQLHPLQQSEQSCERLRPPRRRLACRPAFKRGRHLPNDAHERRPQKLAPWLALVSVRTVQPLCGG